MEKSWITPQDLKNQQCQGVADFDISNSVSNSVNKCDFFKGQSSLLFLIYSDEKQAEK